MCLNRFSDKRNKIAFEKAVGWNCRFFVILKENQKMSFDVFSVQYSYIWISFSFKQKSASKVS